MPKQPDLKTIKLVSEAEAVHVLLGKMGVPPGPLDERLTPILNHYLNHSSQSFPASAAEGKSQSFQDYLRRVKARQQRQLEQEQAQDEAFLRGLDEDVRHAKAYLDDACDVASGYGDISAAVGALLSIAHSLIVANKLKGA